MFLLVLAHLGSPGQRVVKQLLLLFWANAHILIVDFIVLTQPSVAGC